MIQTNFFNVLEPSGFQIMGFKPLLDDEVNSLSHPREDIGCTCARPPSAEDEC